MRYAFIPKLSVCLLSGGALSLATAAAAFDPMDDLVSSAKQEINAKQAIKSGKDQVMNDPRRIKVEQGFWQFFQGKRNARPGETCTAVFWKGDQMISLSGPGGDYKGALLSFVAVQPKNGFPRPDKADEPRQIQVSLQQGSDPPAQVKVFNRTIGGGFSDELVFAVPTIDAAMAGMDDQLNFRIVYEGKAVFELAWHSAHAARQVLKRCLAGEQVNGREVP